MSPKPDGHVAAAAPDWPSFGAPKICEIDKCDVIQSGTYEQMTTGTGLPSTAPRPVREDRGS